MPSTAVPKALEPSNGHGPNIVRFLSRRLEQSEAKRRGCGRHWLAKTQSSSQGADLGREVVLRKGGTQDVN